MRRALANSITRQCIYVLYLEEGMCLYTFLYALPRCGALTLGSPPPPHPPGVPVNLLRELRPVKYPDFMEKKDKVRRAGRGSKHVRSPYVGASLWVLEARGD